MVENDRFNDEKYSDDLFRMAIFMAMEQEGIQLRKTMSEIDIDPPLVENRHLLNKKIKKAIFRKDGSTALGILWNKSMKFSVAVSLFFIVSVFSVVNVEAVNKAFLAWISNRDFKYTEIALETPDNNVAKKIQVYDSISPTYLPEGFTTSTISYSASSNLLEFQDEEIGFIKLSAKSTAYALRVDTEDVSKCEEIEINGNKALIMNNDGIYTLFWEENGYFLTLTSNISRKEIILVANNIAF